MTTLARFASRALAALALCGLLAASAGAATIVIINNNAAGVGFNDPAPRAPVGGNPGVTLGQQRLNVFQQAASIWGAILPSAVTIEVRAAFAAQTCTATSATLGSTGVTTIHANFANADFTNTWYPQSLANKLFGADLNANPDMTMTFNSQLDAGLGAACLGGQSWYYGFDGLEGTNVEMLPVALHEMGHGLGFRTSTSGTTGNFNTGFPDIYDRFLYDPVVGQNWYLMTAAQRAASAISNQLAWTGAATFNAAQTFLGHRPRMTISTPPILAGAYPIGTAAFGPQLGSVTGDLVLVDDGVAAALTSDACEPLVNAAAVNGKIAVIDRGTCTFVIKAQTAQAAGAIAVIIVNNAAGAAPALGGTDPTITIPVISVSQADGNAIKAQLPGTVTVTMDTDPVLLAGADNANRPRMYSPNPFASGSSVSHFDVSMTPNALMEPNINGNLHDTVDMTLNVFQDIGWFPQATATTLARFEAEGRGDGILLRWEFSDPAGVGSITIERGLAETGPFAPVATELGGEGNLATALDRDTDPGVTYWYRLAVTDRAGQPAHEGLVSATRSGTLAGHVFLGAPTPNPATHGTSFTFRLARPEYVKLAITDASGRTIRTLREGMVGAGEHTQSWSGGNDVPSGLYFVSLRTSQGVHTQRVAVVH
jgi:hypothetical protein